MNAPLKSNAELAAFRKLALADQIRAIRGTRVHRIFEVSRDAIDQKARTVELSIASEAPARRWFGWEVLSIDKSAIHDERLRSGAPLLLNHNTDSQIGVIEGFEISFDKKLRVLARFGQSALAEEIWQDVINGIRRSTSIGYVIDQVQLERQEEGIDVFRVSEWTPLEASITPIPMDISVGVGRSENLIKGKSTMENEHEHEAGADTPVPGGYENLVGSTSKKQLAEALRIQDLTAIGEAYKDIGGREIAREIIASPYGTAQDFKKRMWESMSGRQKPLNTAQPADMHYGEGARAGLRHGPLVAFRSEETALRAGLWIQACVIGNKKAAEQYREMGGSILTTGGATVPEELATEVVRLTEDYGVFRRSAKVWPMNSDQLRIARRDTGPTASFIGENDDVLESEQAWGNILLSCKKLAILTRVSNELIEDNAVMLADVLAQDMALAFANKEDDCSFNGTGTSTYGGISGLTQIMIDGSHNAGKVAAASTHKTFATLDYLDLTKLMAALPWYARRGAKWYVSSVGWDALFSRIMAAAGGNTLQDLSRPPQQAFLGYPAMVSQVLPNSTGDLSSKVMVLFGDLSLSSAMGIRRGFTLREDQSRYLEKDQTAFLASQRFDVVNHSCGDNTTSGPVVALIGTT